MTEDDDEIAALAAEKLAGQGLLTDMAFHVKNRAEARRVVGLIRDQSRISEVILNCEAGSLVDEAIGQISDEDVFCSVAIACLNRQGRMERKFTTGKDWCVTRLLTVMKKPENVLRLANSFAYYTPDDWFMAYFLRAVCDHSPALLPLIVQQHPSDAYAGDALKMITDGDAVETLLQTVSDTARRMLVEQALGEFPSDSPARRRKCGKYRKIAHRFGGCAVCECCGQTRENPVGIVTDYSHSFVTFTHGCIQTDPAHRVKIRQDTSLCHSECEALKIMWFEFSRFKSEVAELFSSADGGYLGVVLSDGTVELVPASAPERAGFYSDFFGKNKKAEVFKNVRNWKNIMQVAGNSTFVAGLRSDGTVEYISKEGNENISGIEQWEDVARIAVTGYFGGQFVFAGLKWDGSLEVCGTDQAKDILKKWKNIVFLSGGDRDLAGVDHAGCVHVLRDQIDAVPGRDYEKRYFIEKTMMHDIKTVFCSQLNYQQVICGQTTRGDVMIVYQDGQETVWNLNDILAVHGTCVLLNDGRILDLSAGGKERYTEEITS